MRYICHESLGKLIKRLTIIRDASSLSCSAKEGCCSVAEHHRTVAKRHHVGCATVRRLEQLMLDRGIDGIIGLK